MNEPRRRRARQLAFMLTMHTKERALQMITKLSGPANGFEIWRRFLEEWELAHRGQYRAMLMQLLQFPFMGDRGQALEEWERLVRQCEAQRSDTLQDTIKAAILPHNPQDPEWRRNVGLNATRLQGYEALKSEWKAMHQAYRQWSMADGNDTTPMEVDALMKGKGKNEGKSKGKGKGKDKGIEKSEGKSKDKPTEGTTDTSNVKCFFCKGKGHTRKDCPKFSAWLAEMKTVGHEQSANAIEEDGWIFTLNQEHEELCELIMIDCGASVHVCPPNHGQENGIRKSSKTRPLLTASGTEMKQHGVRQVSYDTEIGKITTDFRVLDVRRPIWANLVVGEGIKHTGTQSDDSSRGRASGTGEGTCCVRKRWTVTENPRCVSRFPHDLRRLQRKKERCTKLQDMCLIEARVNGALQRERRRSHT